MAQTIAAIASLISAVCNIVLMILLYRWYGICGDKRKC